MGNEYFSLLLNVAGPSFCVMPPTNQNVVIRVVHEQLLSKRALKHLLVIHCEQQPSAVVTMFSGGQSGSTGTQAGALH